MARPVRLRKLLVPLTPLLEELCADGVEIRDPAGAPVLTVGAGAGSGPAVAVEHDGAVAAEAVGPAAPAAARLVGLGLQYETTNRALGAEVLDLYRQMRILVELNAALSGPTTAALVAARLVEEAERALPGTSIAFFGPDGVLLAGQDTVGDGRVDPDDPDTTPTETVIRPFGTGSVITAPVEGARAFGHLRAHRATGEFLAPDASLLGTVAALAAPALGRAHAHQQSLHEAQRRQDELRRTVTQLREELDLVTTRMLATIVFTDLVGSTETQARLGDADWAQLIEAHNLEIERLLGRHGGALVEFTGDGCFAWFDSPSRALHCMAELRQFIGSLGLAARIGVHTGEVEQRGRRLSGLSVNIAARVMAVAGADEILVTDVTAQLLAHGSLRFDRRGEVELKGVPGTWPLLALSSGS